MLYIERMAGTDAPYDRDAVANHTLAYLRSLDKKVDLVLETLNRHGERLARLERDVGESRRDIAESRRDVLEVKSDIALLENKVLSSQTEILAILHRLDESALPSVADTDPAAPGPTSSKG
jgi:beta-glucosidase-like glycosyl hydrolase